MRSTSSTYNPVIGCDRVSPGCDNCYPIPLSHMREANPDPKVAALFAGTTVRRDGRTDWSGQVNLLHHRLADPFTWPKRGQKVFVNSLSDLFHANVPDEFIARLFAVMALTPQHTYQILTKRHGRMRTLLRDECRCGAGHQPGVHFRSAMAWAVSKANPDRVPGVPDDAEHRAYHETAWPLPNVWLGVSVEDQQRADLRILPLLETPAAVRFISAEPLLGPLNLRTLRARHGGMLDALHGDVFTGAPGKPTYPAPARLDWVIAGGRTWTRYQRICAFGRCPMTDALTLAYLAGVIDSDGYITIHKSTHKGKPYYAAAIPMGWPEFRPDRASGGMARGNGLRPQPGSAHYPRYRSGGPILGPGRIMSAVREKFWDPEGERFGIPTYPRDMTPPGC